MKTLYKNGNVHTMDEAAPKAEAFVVDGERFIYVGTETGAREYLNQDNHYDEVDLEGRLVLPGFNDSHMHFIHFAKSIRSVNLTGTKSIREIRERMEQGIKSRNSDGSRWLEGEGWNHDYMDEKRFPDKFDLDDITGEVPTLIMRACFHIGVLNSAGMKAIGLNRDTAPKYGNLVELLPDGEPNGVIKENLLEHVKAEISTLDLQILKNIITEAQYKAFSQGLTSVQSDDIGYMPNSDYDLLFGAFKELDEAGILHIRIGEQSLLKDKPTMERFLEKYTYGFGNDKYRVSCTKILSDGSLGARTAALRNPYNDDPKTSGLELFTQDELNELVLCSHRHGCPAAIHAIGDKAIEMSLDAIEYAQKSDPGHSPRHGIVHCQITDEALLDRISRLNVLTLVQPIFTDYDMNIVADRVGNRMAETSYAWKTMIDKGIHVSFGTDCPVELFNTMPNIYSAVTRRNITGNERKVYLPEERLSMHEAIKAYTAEGAYASGEEGVKGTISKGKLADFILLDRDLFNLSNDEEILNTNVVETYVGGKKVYGE